MGGVVDGAGWPVWAQAGAAAASNAATATPFKRVFIPVILCGSSGLA